MQEIGPKDNWTTPIVLYLRDDTLLDSKEAARKLKVQAAWFVLVKDILYKRGFSQLYLRCLTTEKGDYVMREVHEGYPSGYKPKGGNKIMANQVSAILPSGNYRLDGFPSALSAGLHTVGVLPNINA